MDPFDRYRSDVLERPGEDANGWVHERIGPVVRTTTPLDREFGGGIFFSDLGGLSGAEVDAVIAREAAHFATSGRPWEWKTYSRDAPPDLEQRLAAAGLEAGEVEALMIGDVDDVVAACSAAQPPAGVLIREAVSEADFAGIGSVVDENWPQEAYGAEVARVISDEKVAAPGLISVFVAVDATGVGGTVVSAGWIRYYAGTTFTGLYGGNTRAPWRGRGIYTQLVRLRAEQARDRGYRYLQVDASPDSRPILERLGLKRFGTTTPYTWTPPSEP